MEQQSSAKPTSNLLIELAKRKAEAQKTDSGFGRFSKNKGRFPEKAKPFVPRGGRNGQGKP